MRTIWSGVPSKQGAIAKSRVGGVVSSAGLGNGEATRRQAINESTQVFEMLVVPHLRQRTEGVSDRGWRVVMVSANTKVSCKIKQKYAKTTFQEDPLSTESAEETSVFARGVTIGK
jgi:hypothetical protein